ncbi:MAG: type II secretion system GspH family protein [Planctomycetes bacterium]|nr:type II secretion system GspH family protein [Planctomycetota bacterium]
MKTSHNTRQNDLASRSGFTIVELLMSIIVIGTLMALLIVGLRAATRFARTSAERQNVIALREAVTQFRQEFGFVPPLVRDQSIDAPPLRARIEEKLGTGSNASRSFYSYAVYDFAETANGTEWRKFFQREAPPAPPAGFGSMAMYYDKRYSECSLPYYLIGPVEVDLTTNMTGAVVPIDGVTGPGFLKPVRDGTFVVPVEALSDRGSGRLGQKYEPFFRPNNSSIKLYQNPGPTKEDRADLSLRDRNDVPIRYYRWTKSDTRIDRAPINDWLRIPVLVGDPEKSPNLRDATFAIIAAGPDGAFGDEPIAELLQKLGVAPDTRETIARMKAMEDNIVEVGK